MKNRGIVLVLALCFGCRAAEEPSASDRGTVLTARTNASASEALDRLDQRRPVPLLPMMAAHQKQNMREHLQAVQEVIAAVAVGDFDKGAAAAKRMAFSETMGQMCAHMGAGAPGFTEQALAFHHTADEIAIAAGTRDSSATLSALAKTLHACTNCHATFKQQVVANLSE